MERGAANVTLSDDRISGKAINQYDSEKVAEKNKSSVIFVVSISSLIIPYGISFYYCKHNKGVSFNVMRNTRYLPKMRYSDRIRGPEWPPQFLKFVVWVF